MEHFARSSMDFLMSSTTDLGSSLCYQVDIDIGYTEDQLSKSSDSRHASENNILAKEVESTYDTFISG